MSESITISLETYEKLMSTITAVHLENQKIKHILSIYKARAMRQHKSICIEYDAYFSPRNSASLDRHAHEISSKHIKAM